MNKLLLVLTAFMLFLVACTSDLPPEPEAPGLAGNYYRAIGDWATEPVAFGIAGSDVRACGYSEQFPLIYEANDEFVYKYMYVWIESAQQWERVSLSGDEIADSNWIRGTARFSELVTCGDLSDVADSNNEIFAVGYTCRREGSGWNCQDKKWQLDIAQINLCDSVSLELNQPKNFQTSNGDYVVTIVGASSSGGSGSSSAGTSSVMDVISSTVVSRTQSFGSGTTSCPSVSPPVCPNGVSYETVVDAKGCISYECQVVCQAITCDANQCPDGCVYDEYGCLTGDCAIAGSTSIVLEVNGERKSVREGQLYDIGGLQVYVDEIYVTNTPTLSASADVYVKQGNLCLVPVDCNGIWNNGVCEELPEDPNGPGGLSPT